MQREESKGDNALLAASANAGQGLDIILDAIPIPIFYKNPEGVYVGCNTAFEEYLGKSRDQIVGKRVYDVAPDDLATVYRDKDEELLRHGGTQVYETRVMRADGARREVVLSKSCFYKRDGSLGGLVGTLLDITERKLQEQELQHLAFHDPLTGLPNRVLLMDHLKRAMAHAVRHKQTGGVAYVDIDSFKTVNDQHGHAGGDTLLKAFASRLRGCLRETDTLARIGGDEFVCLLPCIGDDPSGASHVAERMLRALSEPVGWRDAELKTSASIGLALFPRDSEDAESLVRCADTAMYQAKNAGRCTYRLFSPT